MIYESDIWNSSGLVGKRTNLADFKERFMEMYKGFNERLKINEEMGGISSFRTINDELKLIGGSFKDYREIFLKSRKDLNPILSKMVLNYMKRQN